MKNLIDIINEKLILSKTRVRKNSEDEYFYHEALEDGYTTKFIGTKNKLQYSIDNWQTWNELKPNTDSPEINKGEFIYFKGENMKVTANDGIGKFISNKKFNVGGNIMSLIYGDDFAGQTELLENDQFKWLFYGNNYLISAKNLLLQTTKLTKQCYRGMFYECKSLKEAPELQARELAVQCYLGMFIRCTSLIEAPKLPATELAEGCYAHMFDECKSLKEAPELPSTELAEECYKFMFSKCILLKEAPELPATKLSDNCYNNMFVGCTSLTKAPKLSATKLVNGCYAGMFIGCTSLKEITMLATGSILVTDYLYYWVKDVSEIGTFTKAKGIDIPTGINGIPEGWTVKEI